ncbi:tail fiber protein [Budviciaceae bacterium BWR-B9]|uniref:Tail fiber protein n=1 Tax=Limnobaculum allomyrinae TaxID=2791986 RepID=A0ABS1IP13_9GAMM|nr:MULTISPECIES: phage tail protein [Limnobaculum]MBK5143389.1 tail fiber protein [Limnobaculum allomyrinae]MBV7691277.1 tail fiber protein [Limnobaculum sp. M2-1]
MALTTEQEQALLALLDEKKITLSELPAATDLSAEDLLLIRQGIIDKSVNNNVLRKYFTPAASSFTDSGIVKLSNAINSDDESIAATSKAVKSAHSIALQASQDVAAKTLSKSANLSDVADPVEVLKNLGLSEAAKRGVGDGENQIPDMNSFTSMKGGANGTYLKLPGGFILQTGRAETNRLSASLINLPIAFPKSSYNIVGVSIDQTWSTVATCAPQTASSFYLSTWGAGSTANLGVRQESLVYWIAFGY